MIDGSVARWTNSVSEAGSRLDTAADFVFLTVAFIKFLSAMQIPGWLWIWAGVIAVIKLSNIIAGLIRGNGFVALHSVMNKITGLVLFLFPLTLSYIEVQYSAAVVCLIATCAAIWECPIFNLAIVLQKRYNELLEKNYEMTNHSSRDVFLWILKLKNSWKQQEEFSKI
jgi:CDP-diacylglycerol--glycerol-3-phosphate 3-phosphatidyltransferase